jgi:hypothetical protein
MRSDESRTALLLRRFSRVGPCERVSHRAIVVIHELPQLVFQVGDRREVPAPQQLPVDDPENDLDLV